MNGVESKSERVEQTTNGTLNASEEARRQAANGNAKRTADRETGTQSERKVNAKRET